MRCLNCHHDGLSPDAQVCPHCRAHLPTLMADLLPHGTLLDRGKYRIDHPLGRGGFGVTYRAAHTSLDNKFYAIKEFFPSELAMRDATSGALMARSQRHVEAYQSALRRFLREGQILARLKHPNIVSILDLFEERGTAYLALELVTGGTLRQEMESAGGKGLPLERVAGVMQRLVAALDVVHAEGVYHLDLKPDNVLVRRTDGEILLADFGAARLSSSSSTTPAFTPQYAPPEVIAGEGAGPHSDVFELGMLLHELLTGALPPQALTRIVNDTWQPNGLTAPWKDLVVEAIRIDRAKRPQSVTAWWQRYEDWRAEQERAQLAAQQRKRQEEEARSKQQEIDDLDRRQREAEAEARRLKVELERKRGRIEADPSPRIKPRQEVDERQHSPASLPSLKSGGLSRRAMVLSLGALVAAIAGIGYWKGTSQQTASNFENPVPTPAPDDKTFVEDLGGGVTIHLARIAAGRFQMGSPANEEGRSNDEGPQHEVRVGPFLMGKFEVTQRQWRAVAGLPKVGIDLNADPSRLKGDDLPVENVNWEDAKEFIARLNRKLGLTEQTGYRLPSEAEWEYAARAGTTTPFAFGATITPAIVNYDGNYPYGGAAKGEYRAKTVEVGSLGRANAWGLFDMHGNVWEWCEDDWHGNYDGAPTDGRAWVDGSSRGSGRVDRGGGWFTSAVICRSAYRHRDSPGDRYGDLGFRLLRTLP